MVVTVRSLGLSGISGYEVSVECFLSGRGDCPYWRPCDEYRTARRQ